MHLMTHWTGDFCSKHNKHIEWIYSRHAPDRLVGEPARVAPVEAVRKSGLQLVRKRDGGTRGMTRRHRLLEVQIVAAGVTSVVEHDTWTKMDKRSGKCGKYCGGTGQDWSFIWIWSLSSPDGSKFSTPFVLALLLVSTSSWGKPLAL